MKKIILVFSFAVFLSSCSDSSTSQVNEENDTVKAIAIKDNYTTDLTADTLIKCMGYSIKSSRLQQLMKELKISLTPELYKDNDSNVYRASSENSNEDIFLDFVGYNRYKFEFGIPSEVQNKNEDELILTEISIDSRVEKTQKGPVIRFPLGLHIGDTKGEIIKKLGKEPKVVDSTMDYGHALWFGFDEFKILTALNKKRELIWTRVILLNTEEKEMQILLNTIDLQVKNIKEENVSKLKKLKTELPTKNWVMVNGASPQGIKEIEAVLINYIDNLIKLVYEKNPKKILFSVKSIVMQLNAINEKYDSFIETSEREDLCDLIEFSVKAAGIQFKEGLDLTLEWREW